LLYITGGPEGVPARFAPCWGSGARKWSEARLVLKSGKKDTGHGKKAGYERFHMVYSFHVENIVVNHLL
jgi:hypothetical protein